MASELAKRLLDAGFPAAKPVHDHELFGIPTLEELIAAVEQIHPGFRLSVKRINPDEWEAHSGSISIEGEVTYWARHWLALHTDSYLSASDNQLTNSAESKSLG